MIKTKELANFHIKIGILNFHLKNEGIGEILC